MSMIYLCKLQADIQPSPGIAKTTQTVSKSGKMEAPTNVNIYKYLASIYFLNLYKSKLIISVS